MSADQPHAVICGQEEDIRATTDAGHGRVTLPLNSPTSLDCADRGLIVFASSSSSRLAPLRQS